MKVNLDQPRDPQAGNAVGSMLRTQRLRLGQEIGFAADQLRIRQAYLVAIEEGRYQDLPGSTYASGFVRAYAEYLGLNAPEIVQQFKRESGGGLDSRPELVFPSPVSEGRIPGGAILFLGLVLAASAYGGWYYMSSSESSVAEMVPAIPERLRAMVQGEVPATPGSEPAAPATETTAPPPAETAAAPAAATAPAEVVPPGEPDDSEPATVAAAPVAAAPAEPSVPAAAPTAPAPEQTAAAAPAPAAPAPAAPAVPAAVPVAEPPAAAEAPPAAAEPQPPAAAAPPPAPETAAATSEGPRIYGQENADARIVLRAVDDSWVQVRENNSVLLMRLMRKGDVYRVPNRPGLTLMTGSAGALEISVDGKPAPSLGAIGTVRRDVALDPDKLAGN